jgi:hypothetical protein
VVYGPVKTLPKILDNNYVSSKTTPHFVRYWSAIYWTDHSISHLVTCRSVVYVPGRCPLPVLAMCCAGRIWK